MVRLQLFNWVLKDEKRRAKLTNAPKTGEIDFMAWGFDPALDTALSLANAEGLIESTSTGVKLTHRGVDFCGSVIKEDLYAEDRAFLESLRTSITEKMVQAIVNKWV